MKFFGCFVSLYSDKIEVFPSKIHIKVLMNSMRLLGFRYKCSSTNGLAAKSGSLSILTSEIVVRTIEIIVEIRANIEKYAIFVSLLYSITGNNTKSNKIV